MILRTNKPFLYRVAVQYMFFNDPAHISGVEMICFKELPLRRTS
jgi:hypothetical protein